MSIQSDFDLANGDDATVVVDTAAVVSAQKTLDTATVTAVNDHATLTTDVVAKGAALVVAKMADGTTEFIALLPQADGTIKQTVLFFDGTLPTPDAGALAKPRPVSPVTGS